MHIHIASAIAGRNRQAKMEALDKIRTIAVCEVLQEVAETGNIEATLQNPRRPCGSLLRQGGLT